MHAFRAGTQSLQNGGWNLDEADNQRIDLRTAWPGVGVYINRALGGAGNAVRAFLGPAIGPASLADGRGPAHYAERANQSADGRQEKCVVSGAIAICRSRGIGIKRQEGETGVHGTHDAGGVAANADARRGREAAAGPRWQADVQPARQAAARQEGTPPLRRTREARNADER